MAALLGGLAGAIAGSFLNALSFRAGTGRSVMHGRSRCMRCGQELSVSDLVPVLSWLMLGGRCRYCGARISVQYPLVELAAAGLGAGVAALEPNLLFCGLWFLAWMTLLYTLVYDVRHAVIPWACSGIVALLGLAHVLLTGASAWALAAGPLVALPLLLLSLVSRGRWMGWGDGALMVGVGWLLGLSAGYTALMVAFWAGAAVGIALILLRRGYTMGSELPFAPFLILGAALAYFFHADIFATLPALFS